MKHYFTWSTHIIIGLILIIIALLLWRGHVWAPQTHTDIPSSSVK